MKPSDFKLTEQEKNSALWHRLKEHIEARIDKHRATNDKTQTPEATEKLRGRIAELKDLLNIEKDRPQIEQD